MAHARPVVPGRFYFVTRRCARREFLLRPGRLTNQAVLYCLAEAATATGIYVLWLMAMSNHLHYGLYDPAGVYPEFLQRFHGNLSKVLNCHWGRWGNLFEYEQTSMVELADPEAAFDKMIYSLTNPAKDHLVKRAADWPGASSLPYQLDDRALVVRRPDWFFADDSSMPEEVELRFHRLETLLADERGTDGGHAAWADAVRRAICKVERKALEERRATGRTVMGRGAVLAQSAFNSPSTHEPRRQVSPRVAGRNKWRRIELLQRNEAWGAAYSAALAAYRDGDKAVVFPPGTWKLHVEGHVQRAAA